MSEIYKGLEIMKMISKGQIADGTRFNFENNNFDGIVEYSNGILYWIIVDEKYNETGKKNLFEMFNIQSTMIADFEVIDEEIDIDNIEDLRYETVIETLGKCDCYTGNEYYCLKTLSKNDENLLKSNAENHRKINELIKAVKQINNKLKEK